MMSVYAMVRARTGNSAGDRELRAIAINMARIRMSGADQANILTSRMNASSSRGNELRKRSPLKNDCRTRSHRGICGTRSTIAATTISELTVATAILRRFRACSYAARRLVVVAIFSQSLWCGTGRYLITGISALLDNQVLVISASDPLSLIAARAVFAQPTNSFSRSKTKPNSSADADASAGN